MFTPQQIDQIAFKSAAFNGYDKKSVDEVLEPLTEDYITLYKENALLKSKMRVLVSKLEEYRKNETSMKDAIVNAQKTCDKMVAEAEAKCAKMLNNANALASQKAAPAPVVVPASEDQIAAENARVEEARRVAAAKISELQMQISSCVEMLERADPEVTKNMGLIADFFHLQIEEVEVAQAIRDAGKWIRHVHLGDSNRLAPGYGHTDWKSGFAALKEIGYGGWFTLEADKYLSAFDADSVSNGVKDLAASAHKLVQMWEGE